MNESSIKLNDFFKLFIFQVEKAKIRQGTLKEL